MVAYVILKFSIITVKRLTPICNNSYVGQVDYDATLEELRVHFGPCGTINRITIMCNKLTGQSKG